MSLLLCISQGGNSSLHFAALNGHLEIVKLLIQNGASSTQRNNVSVIVKQVIHIPLCAHVQVRYTVCYRYTTPYVVCGYTRGWLINLTPRRSRGRLIN